MSTPLVGPGPRRRRLGGLQLPALLPEERPLAGRLAGALYLVGAGSAVLLLIVPGGMHERADVILPLAAVGAIWGVCCLTVVPWKTAPPVVSHLSSSMGFVIAAAVIAASGGADSPARFYFLFIAIYAACFYPRRCAWLYLAGCAIAHAMPLVYDTGAIHQGFLRELMVIVPTYAVLGGGVIAGKAHLHQLREDADRLAHEQGALRRVATSVAARRAPDEIYEMVSLEIAGLLGASASGIVRLDSVEQYTVVGSWSQKPGGRYEPGTVGEIGPGSELEQMLRTGRPVRSDHHPPGSVGAELGFLSSVIAPVHVGKRVWGALAITSDRLDGLHADAPERLSDFGDLLATAIANTEDRRKLAAQASTDPLTGLANHRTFHERLRSEVGRAQRHGRTLALALIDLDQFKEINDSEGHRIGDGILSAVADRLRQVARGEDLLARIGGDEFALLLPETGSLEALNAIERARRLVATAPVGGRRVTLSAGIADLEHAGSADDLFRLADGALYWSKAHGRDCAWIYDPAVIQELSAQERAEHLERSQALTGLRALARAIDAKDPTTRLHSERVAALACRLAENREWPGESLTALQEAALIHDVGKIGVPDAVLLKPGALNDAEYEQVKQHAALSAQIAEEVLGAEQVDWIRAHHERPDGGGYPAGLVEDQISEGAALLALADAWDVMTVSRPYSAPKTVDQALSECQNLVGRQFTAAAVAALVELHAQGLFDQLEPAKA